MGFGLMLFQSALEYLIDVIEGLFDLVDTRKPINQRFGQIFYQR